MIELLPCPDRRVVIACDACSKPITRAADAVMVPWASRTALVCHKSVCLASLRLQYPSTAREPVVELADALEQLAGLLDEPAAIAAEGRRKKSEAAKGMPYAGKGGTRKEKVVDHNDPLPSERKHVAREARAAEAHDLVEAMVADGPETRTATGAAEDALRRWREFRSPARGVYPLEARRIARRAAVAVLRLAEAAERHGSHD